MAAPRKPFSQLKPATQQRKARYYAKHHGLTAKQVETRYDNGTLGSQKASRGHARTPEKPGSKPPGTPSPVISDYERLRQIEINKIQAFKQRKWGGRPKWNGGRSRKFVSHNPETGLPRGIRELKKISAICDFADQDALFDWHDVAALDYDEEDAFYYH